MHGGSIQVAGGAQISGSSVGATAGLVLRDNMFAVQRPAWASSLRASRAVRR
jgi:hypothetical protein